VEGKTKHAFLCIPEEGGALTAYILCQKLNICLFVYFIICIASHNLSACLLTTSVNSSYIWFSENTSTRTESRMSDGTSGEF